MCHWEIQGRFRKRVFWRMYPRSGSGEHANVPSFRFSFRGEHPKVPSFRFSLRGNIRQNHPFGKPPFCQPQNVCAHQFRESLWELLKEWWFSYCSTREMPFRAWNFAFRESLSKFRELLREYPGTLRELREWPFHSESVFPEIGVVPRLLNSPTLTTPLISLHPPLAWVHAKCVVRQHSVLQGFWEEFSVRVLRRGPALGFKKVLRRVLRRGSEHGVSRRCLERPLGEYDPLGVYPTYPSPRKHHILRTFLGALLFGSLHKFHVIHCALRN